MKIKANGCISHIVLKIKDIKKYCTDEQIQCLSEICKTVTTGRISDGKSEAEYYICNKDELYAENVHAAIISGEGINYLS